MNTGNQAIALFVCSYPHAGTVYRVLDGRYSRYITEDNHGLHLDTYYDVHEAMQAMAKREAKLQQPTK